MTTYQVSFSTLPNRLSVDPNDNLLDALLSNDIPVAYGCKDGACATCKYRVISGQTHLTKEVLNTVLTPEERQENITLLCCTQAQSDLILEPLSLTQQTIQFPARIDHLEKLSDDVMLMRLKLPAQIDFQYRAGQFIEFVLKDDSRRAYSIANAPHVSEGHIELHLRFIPGGSFSEQVFSRSKEKEIVRLEGPLGNVYLQHDNKPIIFLAGGTGFAPIKALVEEWLISNPQKPAYLYWGNKNIAGFYLPDLPKKWADHELLHYIPVLSEEDNQWTSRTGLVHEAVLSDHDNLAGWQVYACGSPDMVNIARETFLEKGLTPEDFYADAFTFSTKK